MKHLFLILFALTATLAVSAQSADKLYQEGKKLYDAKNYTAAVPKLKAAAEKGHKKAQYRLARCYDKGYGVTEDNALAVKWYQKAAEQGHAKSQYLLGKAYMKGKKGLPADQQKAKAWLTKAVKNEKDGSDILKKMRKEAKEGDEDAKKMLKLIGKS